MQPTTDAINCATIVNEINVLSSTASNPTPITKIIGPLMSGNIGSKLALNPDSLQNIGDYMVQMRSCITYGDGTYTVCANGTPFIVSIEDPCNYTGIRSAIFDRIMARPQLQSDTLNLLNEIAIGRWPWAVQLDLDTGANYPDNLCGLISYQVMT